MAFGTSSRLDSRRASPYCSTTAVVVFVALGLIGVWMMTSSPVVPVDMSDNESETNNKLAQTDSRSFENRQADVTEDSARTYGNESDNNIPNDSDSGSGKTTETSTENTEVDNSSKGSDDSSKDESQDASNTGTFSDNNGEEGGDSKTGSFSDNNSEVGGETTESGDADQETNTGSKGGRDSNNIEDRSKESENDQQTNKVKKPDQYEKTSGDKSQDERNDGPTKEKMEQDGDKSQDEKNEGPNEEKSEQDGEKSQDEKEEDPIEKKSDQDGGKNTRDSEGNKEGDQLKDTGGNEVFPSGAQSELLNETNTQNGAFSTQAVESNMEKMEQDGDKSQDEKNESSIEEKSKPDGGKNTQDSEGNKEEEQLKDTGGNEVFPSGAQSELLNETNTQNGAFSTQAMESMNEKELQKNSSPAAGGNTDFNWKFCQVSTGEDYIPCLDNEAAIKMLHFTGHYEHRERHCPEEAPTCLVPLPSGYKPPIRWPISREKIWYTNVPHTKLAQVKGHQNWVNVSGDYIYFPGGGTQFIHGALHYIDVIQESLPDIAWGKKSRVVLDVGCGVASFGGFLFDRDVLTMSFAPKDEHEAQVQFALERGIPAFSAVMGTKRLPFPSKVFDIIHCARCRVPWHIEGGKLLLELNRLLRPGGYFVWSATPVYRTDAENVGIWEVMTALTKSMCWEMVTKTSDRLNQVGLAIYRKPSDNNCYEKRAEDNPPLCQQSDDPDAAWNITLQACMHRLPVDSTSRGKLWPEQWPLRLEKVPYWLSSSQTGVYGKPAPQDFVADYEHWKRVSKSYINGMGINWSTVRNVMDMRSVYGGFAAALREMKVWVMNIVSIDSPDTLPVIYERGLFGMYHDWCESFSTYPRSYDLLHADHLFSKVKKKCQLLPVIVEADRVLRPEGKLIVRDDVATLSEVENLLKSLHWEIRLTYSKDSEGILCAQKTMWRPS